MRRLARGLARVGTAQQCTSQEVFTLRGQPMMPSIKLGQLFAASPYRKESRRDGRTPALRWKLLLARQTQKQS